MLTSTVLQADLQGRQSHLPDPATSVWHGRENSSNAGLYDVAVNPKGTHPFCQETMIPASATDIFCCCCNGYCVRSATAASAC